MPDTQASRIIKRCGVERLASWTGRTKTSVYRWDHAKEKGGSGGVIPSAYHQSILDGARKDGIDLTPEDFFDMPSEVRQ